MDDEDARQAGEITPNPLEPRPPREDDLVQIPSRLNELDARYIVIDLMKAACGIEYAEAAKDIVIRELQGVPIPFASPRLLWRMKVHTNREKDRPDLQFLRQLFAETGEPEPQA